MRRSCWSPRVASAAGDDFLRHAGLTLPAPANQMAIDVTA
jgi:hypothetical protein